MPPSSVQNIAKGKKPKGRLKGNQITFLQGETINTTNPTKPI